MTTRVTKPRKHYVKATALSISLLPVPTDVRTADVRAARDDGQRACAASAGNSHRSSACEFTGPAWDWLVFIIRNCESSLRVQTQARMSRLV